MLIKEAGFPEPALKLPGGKGREGERKEERRKKTRSSKITLNNSRRHLLGAGTGEPPPPCRQPVLVVTQGRPTEIKGCKAG